MVGATALEEADPALKNNVMVNYLFKIREDHAKTQKKDFSHVFRKKSRMDFIRLSCIVVGIEFAYAAETAFVSPILLQIGIKHEHMTMVWGLSPLFGFFLAPLLGSLSDRCRLGLGRRRPVIFLLTIGIIIGLILVPYGKDLGILLGDTEIEAIYTPTANLTHIGSVAALVAPKSEQHNDFKYAVILTVIGTILLDFDADTCQTPARAYLLDVCIPEDQARALSTFTIMAGLGGTCGYALGGVDWEQTQIGNYLGGNIKTVFTIVTVIFILCFLITVTSFREIPLPLIEQDELLRPLTAAAIKKEIAKNHNNIFYIQQTTSLQLSLADKNKDSNEKLSNEIDFVNCPIETYKEISQEYMKPDEINYTTIENPNKLDIVQAEDDLGYEKVSLIQYLKSIIIMPNSLAILCLTNLLTWMSHVCYCLYFTDFVGEAVFGGDPSSDSNSEKNLIYEEGVRFGCWGLSIYAFSCSLYSMCIERLLKIFSLKSVYIGGMVVYAIGMFILAVWPTKIGVLALSTTAGIIYATLFTIPYILVARYHAKGCFKISNGKNVPIEQSRGLGTDIAIISSMIFVAQLIVSLSIGLLISWIDSTCAVLYAASALSLGSAFSAMFVLYLD